MNDQWSEPQHSFTAPGPNRHDILNSVAHRVTLLILITLAVVALWALSSRPEPAFRLGTGDLPTSADFARIGQTPLP